MILFRMFFFLLLFFYQASECFEYCHFLETQETLWGSTFFVCVSLLSFLYFNFDPTLSMDSKVKLELKLAWPLTFHLLIGRCVPWTKSINIALACFILLTQWYLETASGILLKLFDAMVFCNIEFSHSLDYCTLTVIILGVLRCFTGIMT